MKKMKEMIEPEIEIIIKEKEVAVMIESIKKEVAVGLPVTIAAALRVEVKNTTISHPQKNITMIILNLNLKILIKVCPA
jgi:hypothetical protein